MAQNTTIILTPGEWTQLTNADVAAITFQNRSDYNIYLVVQNGTTPPTDFSSAFLYPAKHGEASRLLTELAPGVTTPNRVFAYATNAAEVFVSHA